MPTSTAERQSLMQSLTATTMCGGCGVDGSYQRHCAGCGAQAAIVLDAGDHGMSLCRGCEAEVMRSRIETAEHRGCEPEDPLVYLAGVPAERLAQRAAERAERVAHEMLEQIMLFAQCATTTPPSTRHALSWQHQQRRTRAAPAAIEMPSLWADALLAPA